MAISSTLVITLMTHTAMTGSLLVEAISSRDHMVLLHPQYVICMRSYCILQFDVKIALIIISLVFSRPYWVGASNLISLFLTGMGSHGLISYILTGAGGHYDTSRISIHIHSILNGIPLLLLPCCPCLAIAHGLLF